MRKRIFPRRSRRAAGSPYEMQQISICRLGLGLAGATNTCVQPAQFATGLVSPRSEFASAPAGVEVIPPFAKGVTVGGLRFRYSYAMNALLAFGLGNVSTFFAIRSGLVVLPLQDTSAQIPGVFPTNLLHYSGTIPEFNTIPGLGFTRPRILWRGLDILAFPGSGPVTDQGDVLNMTGSGAQPDLQVVKSKVSLGHNECLYFVTEITTGIDFSDPLVGATVELDLFGVAAVKPTTQTR